DCAVWKIEVEEEQNYGPVSIGRQAQAGDANPGGTMTRKADKKVWCITGAGRGMGIDFAKAALAAGHAVVATGRDEGAVARAVGTSGDLLVLKLDVTNRADAAAAVRAAVDRFGRIDVLVNKKLAKALVT